MLDGGDVFGGGQRLFEHGATRHLDGFLLQVAHDRVSGAGDRALVRTLSTGDDVEKRGLSGAVGADEGDTVSGPHAQTRLLEQDARTKRLADVVDTENHSGESSTRPSAADSAHNGQAHTAAGSRPSPRLASHPEADAARPPALGAVGPRPELRPLGVGRCEEEQAGLLVDEGVDTAAPLAVELGFHDSAAPWYFHVPAALISR